MSKKKETKKIVTPKPPKEVKVTIKDEIAILTTKLKPAMVRFVYLYMGSEDGKGFNNATLSYIIAYNVETSLRRNEKTGKYSKEYINAKTRGYELLTNRDIQKLRHHILLDQGFNTDNIKKRYVEIANQNKNLPLALSANDRIAKITGVVKDDSKQVDIPQLTELTEHIKRILTPKK
jgi:hypothetical protein